jgi:pyruvate dehydrogenase E2 component (dihydrolipoamide acetyltransferase)
MGVPFRLGDVASPGAEGFVVHWFRAEGEPVRAGDLLLEVQFDKVAVEVTAPADGLVARIHAAAGQPVRPGDLLCEIAPSAAEGGPPAPDPPSPAAGAAAPPRGDREGSTASPAARRLARELGVDLRAVRGTGPGGRVTEADVRRVAAARNAPVRPGPLPGVPGRWEAVPPAQRVVAARMSESAQHAPQVTLQRRADVTRLLAVRETWRARGSAVSLTDLLHRAAVLAVLEHPRLQAVWQEDALFVPSEVHLGFAVDRDDGLVVPVIRRADRLDLAGLARERRRLAEAARRGALSPEDLQGATFTVTNLGLLGVEFFTPLLNPPQAAVLGVGRIAAEPRAPGDATALRRVIALSLTFDHRVVNGAPAARFLARLAELLEEPDGWARPQDPAPDG